MSILTFAGIPAETFRIEAGNDACEQTAARELASYIEMITGKAPGGENLVTLGIDASLPREGYRIDCRPGILSVTGGTGRGLLYGVYSMLESVGVRFFTPKIESLGHGGDVPEGATEWSPIFEFRMSDWPCGNDPAWAVKNKINSQVIPDELGGYVKWDGYVHTLPKIIGHSGSGQPCFSDPEILKKAIQYVRGVLEADPTVKVIVVDQNDNGNYCTCPVCAAIDAEEESHMGSLIRFINAIADDIKDDYPDTAIETLAYIHTRKPPKLTKPRPNVIIRLCPIECDFGRSLYETGVEYNDDFREDLVGWGKICDRLYIWDYVVNYKFYVPFFPNLNVLRPNMRYYSEHHARGMYPLGAYNSDTTEFPEMRCYLLAKLMADPKMSDYDYYQHMDEFLEGYYGAGWVYIRAFLDLMMGQSHGEFVTIWHDPTAHYKLKKLEPLCDTIEDWWDRAEAMARDGDELARIRKSRLSWTFILLMVRPDPVKGKAFREEVDSFGVRWSEYRVLFKHLDYGTPPSSWIKLRSTQADD